MGIFWKERIKKPNAWGQKGASALVSRGKKKLQKSKSAPGLSNLIKNGGREREKGPMVRPRRAPGRIKKWTRRTRSGGGWLLR